jgi:response regulator of citrate/malate metabolism
MKIMKNEKKTVLIVDDSILIMERMIPILEEIENISFVVQAGSFREAIEVLNTLKPDMVLLDINLPDRSGIDLLRIIREQQMEVTVLMISNHADGHYQETCRRLGARDFLDKSADLGRISGVLSAAC